MQRRFCLLSTLIVAGALGLGGCPSPTDPTVVLTEEQKAAVKFVAEQLRAANAVLCQLRPIANPLIRYDTNAAVVPFGTCPVTTALGTDDFLAMTMTFNPACSGGTTGGSTIGGGLGLRFTRATGVAKVDFNSLVIDGRAVSGGIPPVTGDNSTTLQTRTGGVLLSAGSVLIVTDGVGTAVGTLTAEIDWTGRVALTESALTFASGGVTRAVTLSGVTVTPTSTGSVLPTAGTATFTVGSDALVITFLSQTPTNGTVQVKVGANPAGNYQVPGLVP
jgi:hypothetical protein